MIFMKHLIIWEGSAWTEKANKQDIDYGGDIYDNTIKIDGFAYL